MNFGWLEPDEMAGKTFPLPPDPAENRSLLRHAQTARPLHVQVGLAEWNVKEWRGRLYPARTREADIFQAYMERYRCMEFNGTHYKIYPKETIMKWREQVQHADFQFLPKFPQLISHQSHFVNPTRDTELFFESISGFEPHLGPLFIQTSEYFAPTRTNQENLYRYLGTLPHRYTYFVEFRHPEWFSEKVLPIWTEALRDLGIGAVITDTPGRRDACHMHLTLPKAFIRFVGKSRVPSTYQRIEDWMERLKSWEQDGLEQAHFIVHCGLSAPEMSRYVIARVNAVLHQNIPDPDLAKPLFDPFEDALQYGILKPENVLPFDSAPVAVQTSLF